MAPRFTRGSAAKEAAFIASSVEENVLDRLSSPTTNSTPPKKCSTTRKKPATREVTEPKIKSSKTAATAKSSSKAAREDAPVTSSTTTKKRKRTGAAKLEEDSDELPHGLGKPWKPNETTMGTTGTTASRIAKKEEVDGETITDIKQETAAANKPVEDAVAAIASNGPEGSPTKKSRKKKTNPYGLTPGVSPFPDWPHPTPEECQQVNDLLSTIHGTVKAPENIPEPSVTFAGCGEVPSVLDALIRTLLSAATSGTNSSRAFQGLVKEYGRKTTGIGKGSVDWDAVRRSDVSRIFSAIKSGGLADVKSKKIKMILDMVYEENQARRNALVKAGDEEDAEKAAAVAPKGAQHESEEEKNVEIQAADEDVLSLDYLHSMPSQEAFNHMLKYPGIGVKTASCVTMFCLRRPSFAVDTHVFRLCQWLGWVPAKANRDTTFMHCEVLVPDELKYSLHQLLIQHGKKCGRCRAITGESSEGWGKGCVIDHLVKRTGVRKGGLSPVKVKKTKKAKKGAESDEDENEDTDMKTDGGGDSNFGKPTSIQTTRTTPRRATTRAKQEVTGEDEDENEEEDKANDVESDFEPPAKKQAKSATPKKRKRTSNGR
ncbi:MAG: hypothetical protein Q9209_001657 [Squamulea sp. 1 TL-2023]